MPVRVAEERKRMPEPSSGFSAGPIPGSAGTPPPPASASREAGAAGPLASGPISLPPVFPSGARDGTREAVDELTGMRLGPVIFEGDRHFVRFRRRNGRLELGVNPEWRSLEEIVLALQERQGRERDLPGEFQAVVEKSAQALHRLYALLPLRANPFRHASVDQEIQALQGQAQVLFQILSRTTNHLDIYGGILHGEGPEDTDVVGFDPEADVELGELEDPAPYFEEEAAAAPADGGVANMALFKADGPSLPLDRTSAAQARQLGSGGGQALSRELRSFFEPRLGRSLAHVRLHTDEQADLLSRRFNARAFTLGHHIAVRRDQFQPHTREGRWLLAHELAHTMPAGWPGSGALPRLGSTRDRAERAADRAADAAMEGRPDRSAPPEAAVADGVVRRAPPKGTQADPIKIAFFKTKGIYKNIKIQGYSGGQETLSPFAANELPTPKMKATAAQVGAAAVSKKIGGAGNNVKGVRIGVTDPNVLLKGKVLKRILSPPRWAEGIFKTALAGRGFDWTNFAPDHLHDLAMSGPDRFPNLWPLDSTTNTGANKTYQQKVQYQDAAGTTRTNAVSFLTNKWFKITKLKAP